MSELPPSAIYGSFAALRAVLPDYENAEDPYALDGAPALVTILRDIQERHGNDGVVFLVHAIAMHALTALGSAADEGGIPLATFLDQMERRLLEVEQRRRGDEG